MAKKIEPINLVIGGNIKRTIDAAGITAEELADKLGISRQQVYNYIGGIHRISAARLWEIAGITKVQAHIGGFFSRWIDVSLRQKSKG